MWVQWFDEINGSSEIDSTVNRSDWDINQQKMGRISYRKGKMSLREGRFNSKSLFTKRLSAKNESLMGYLPKINRKTLNSDRKRKNYRIIIEVKNECSHSYET